MRHPQDVPERRCRAAPFRVALALLVCAALPAEAQTIRGSGQEVRERLEANRGAMATVCVEAARGITRSKRAVVSYAGGSVAVSTTDARGTSCASFDPGDERVTVRLEFQRLGLVHSRLATRAYAGEALRGRVLTFRWVEG
jgi:hypothetical protein